MPMYFNTGVLNFNILKIFLCTLRLCQSSRLLHCCYSIISMGDSQTITILSFIFFIFFDDAMNDK